MDNGLIPAKLLYALARKRKWGESHTAYENMLRQFKSEAFGKHGMKIVEGIAEEIIRFSEEPMTLWSDPSHVRFHGHSGVGFATQHCRMANLAPKCHADAMTLRTAQGTRIRCFGQRMVCYVRKANIRMWLIRKSSFRLIAIESCQLEDSS